MSKQLKADLMLLVVTLGWGVSFYLIDLVLEDMGPFTLNAFRFLLSFAVVCLLSYRRISLSKDTIIFSLSAGAMMACAYMFSTFGIMYTSLSNSAFLASMTVLFTPLFAFMFKGQRPSPRFKVVLLLSVVGMALLTLNEGLRPALGDIFSIICAVTFAVNLLLVETAVKRPKVDAFSLGVCLLAVVGILMLIASFLFEQPHLPSTAKYWAAALFLALFCTGLAVIVQALAQQHTTASHVGLIYSLEPIFAAIVAYIMAGEVLKVRGYIGAAMMLSAVLLMELDLGHKVERIEKKLEQ